MSTVLRPPPRTSRQVYRRRRAVALALLTLLVVGLVLAVRALASIGDEPSTVPAPAPTGAAADQQQPAPSGSASESAADPATDGGCAPGAVLVVATADATSYPVGSTATVGMTITNTGTSACALDAGSAALELLVVSGADRIWSSDDCEVDAESRVLDVAPGEAGMLASSVSWPLERSAAGCAEGLPELRPGTYQLTARAGDVTSEPLTFQVT